MDDGGLGNMVGTAVDFSLGFIFMPSFLEVTEVNSKQSSVKCSQHIAEYLLRPFHLSLVICTWSMPSLAYSLWVT